MGARGRDELRLGLCDLSIVLPWLLLLSLCGGRREGEKECIKDGGLFNAHSTVDYITLRNCHHFGISAFVYDCFCCSAVLVLYNYRTHKCKALKFWRRFNRIRGINSA